MNINEQLLTTKNLIILSETVATCSFTKAAARLGMQQPNVSAAMHELEEKLNVKLFSNVPHGVVPTEAAIELNKYALQLKAMLHAVQNYSLTAHQYSGTIRLWMTDGLGSFCLAKQMTEFCKQFPDVRLEITCSNDTPNILSRETDIAIVYKEPMSSESVVISKHNVVFGLFASLEYLAQHGNPQSIEDLLENHYICDRKEYKTEWTAWSKMLKKAKKTIAYSNSTNVLTQLTKLGIGIGLHPINSGHAEKDLIQVLPDFTLEHPYWLVSHIDAKDTPKVREMLNKLKEIMNKL